MGPNQKLEAQILNNLAFASWMHVLEIPKIKLELLGPDKPADGEAEPVTSAQKQEFEE